MKIISIIGRLNGPKGVTASSIIEKVIPIIVRKYPDVKFHFVGGPVDSNVEKAYKTSAARDAITLTGVLDSLDFYFQKSDIIVGAGRVAIEAIKNGKRLLAVGEKRYIGQISPNTLYDALRSNFGDCADDDRFDWQTMISDLDFYLGQNKESLEAIERYNKSIYEEYFQKTKLLTQIGDVYSSVMLKHNLLEFSEIPVLMYHRVVKSPVVGSVHNTYITTGLLEKHFRFLVKNGFQTITFADLYELRIEKKPVIITFDDGFQDNYENLLPLLKKYNLKAVLYVLVPLVKKFNDWDEKDGEPQAPLMDATEIKSMSDSGLVEIGSHGFSHKNFCKLSDDELKHELVASKLELEKITNKKVISLAYPFGIYNHKVKQATIEAGYEFSVATDSGPVRFSEDLFAIRRIQIFPHTSVAQISRKTNGYYLRYQEWKKKIRSWIGIRQ